MSKYKPLADFLGAHAADIWKVTFDDLETALGFSLPKAARSAAAWWANDTDADKPHKKAWLGAGWRTEDVDLAKGAVTFRRGATSAAPDTTAHAVMAAADAQFEKVKTAEKAKKAGLVAAVVGVVAAGAGVVAAIVLGRKK